MAEDMGGLKASEWLQIAQTIVMTAVMGLTYLWGKGRKAESDLLDRKFADLERETGAMRLTMSKAGERMSDLATNVQGLPERFRAVFATRPELEALDRMVRDGRAEVAQHHASQEVVMVRLTERQARTEEQVKGLSARVDEGRR
jgi:hypothetical protein